MTSEPQPQTVASHDVAPVTVAPPLWNPGAAAAWSLLFSPIFGAFVQMKNWETLGDPRQAAASRTWIGIGIVVVVVFALAGAILPDSGVVDGVSRALGIALWVTWYYVNGKAQVLFVADRFGKRYPRRGWGKPLLLAIVALVAFAFVVFAIAFVVEAIVG